MSADQSTETAQVSISSTDNYATVVGAQRVWLVASADCYIDFDQPAVTTRSLLLKANQVPAEFEFSGANISKIHVIGTSGTLYVLIARN